MTFRWTPSAQASTVLVGPGGFATSEICHMSRASTFVPAISGPISSIRFWAIEVNSVCK